MKLGVHSATFVEDWSDDIKPYIEKCLEAGYRSIEVSLLGQDKIKAKEIGLFASDNNIEITCTTGLSANEDITSSENEIRLNGEKKLLEAIELTSLMNSSMLSGVIHCAWGISKEKGAGKEIKFKNSANSLTKLTKALEDNNIKLGIEPLNRYETDFIN
ncbi:MAG: TIM barrel protein, partial [Proteobacteria bacterium]|nr:TIM barrel protein [Pseudomonadota bacterium]